MLGLLPSIIEIALFIAAIVWAGNRPNVHKVSIMIVVFAAFEICLVMANASAAGMTPSEWYVQGLHDQLQASGAGEQASLASNIDTVAECWPAIYIVGASVMVFIALCIRWIYERVRKMSTWTAFSELDLSIWWVVPCIVGIVLYIVSMIPGVPHSEEVFTVAINVVIVSIVPLFVQGAAVGKAIMNRRGFGIGLQLALGLFCVLLGIVFAVLPVMGVIDFWANIRKLPRDSKGEKAE